jgi:HSP20 family protein
MFGELIRWDPRGELSSWHRDIDDLFSRFFGRDEFLGGRWMPPMEAYRKEVDVHVEGNLLTIKGERKTEEKGQEYRETFYGRFERTVTLPHGAETEKIVARYENGVLEISVPLPKELVGRAIPIETGGKMIGRKAA